MTPPFTITPLILRWVSQIERLIGRIEGLDQPKPQPHLRKTNRVRTVHGSLSIEGNTLDLDQVTALLEGKRVLGPQEEIREVLNAIQTYDRLADFDPLQAKSLLQAHQQMMQDLIPNAGKWRRKNVGILKGSTVSHIAPQADRVPYLMDDLFAFLAKDDLHLLIRSSVFHYELEFIHPFQDGNGRIGRFWQSVLLYHYHPAFEFIPLESLIKDHQQDYYQALENADRAGDSTHFVEFSLEMIHHALEDFLQNFSPKPLTAQERLDRAAQEFPTRKFSRKDYLALFKTISTATASRDLKHAVESGLLQKQGEKAQTAYEFRKS